MVKVTKIRLTEDKDTWLVKFKGQKGWAPMTPFPKDPDSIGTLEGVQRTHGYGFGPRRCWGPSKVVYAKGAWV